MEQDERQYVLSDTQLQPRLHAPPRQRRPHCQCPPVCTEKQTTLESSEKRWHACRHTHVATACRPPTLTPNLSLPHKQPPKTWEAAEDTLSKLIPEFVPVVGFIHTMRLRTQQQALPFKPDTRRWGRPVISTTSTCQATLPTTTQKTYTLKIHWPWNPREGFNRWVKSGLRLFARHDFYKYTLPDQQRLGNALHGKLLHHRCAAVQQAEPSVPLRPPGRTAKHGQELG